MTYTNDKFNGRSTTPLRVYKKDGTAIPFDTPFASLREVCEVLRAEGGSFSMSLVRDIESVRGPTAKQAAWAHKLATDAITPRTVEPTVGGLAPVIAMLDKAAHHQKRMPKIELRAGEQRVVIKRRKDGSAAVTDGRPYGDNTLFGFVEAGGNYRPTRGNLREVETVLRELAADPARVAGQHGVATGNCCFCNTALSDRRSRSVGYGPICAEKFGLPWGTSEVADAADKAAKA
tara:strand:- start:2043 stop:2741 length:699 start_codon:yes stop_codon:yes gene_type:complete